MEPITVKELNRLHDCELLNILFDTSSNTEWSIQLTIRCADDPEYSPWDGKLLVVSALDVVSSNYAVRAVSGAEIIDHVYPGVSARLKEGTMKGRPPSVYFKFEFTVALISGSSLEVICQDLRATVQP